MSRLSNNLCLTVCKIKKIRITFLSKKKQNRVSLRIKNLIMKRKKES
jgi:hypothetical protein